MFWIGGSFWEVVAYETEVVTHGGSTVFVIIVMTQLFQVFRIYPINRNKRCKNFIST